MAQKTYYKFYCRQKKYVTQEKHNTVGKCRK